MNYTKNRARLFVGVVVALSALIILAGGVPYAAAAFAAPPDLALAAAKDVVTGAFPAVDGSAVLYESATGALANGQGTLLLTGATDAGLVRRSLLRFDIAESGIPEDAAITSVQLSLYCLGADADGMTLSLRRVAAPWEAGPTTPEDEFEGAAAVAGDVTWLHTSYDAALWAAAGGDARDEVSAAVTVGHPGWYDITSAQLMADVQDMLDAPENNHGWLLSGDESAGLLKYFASETHDNEHYRPRLLVVYEAPDEGEGEAPEYPVVDFSAAPRVGVAPLTVAFTSLCDPGPDAQLVSHAWDFGDGATSNEENPVHEYVNVGEYTVTLTVDILFDDEGEPEAFERQRSSYIEVSDTPPGEDLCMALLYYDDDDEAGTARIFSDYDTQNYIEATHDVFMPATARVYDHAGVTGFTFDVNTATARHDLDESERDWISDVLEQGGQLFIAIASNMFPENVARGRFQCDLGFVGVIPLSPEQVVPPADNEYSGTLYFGYHGLFLSFYIEHTVPNPTAVTLRNAPAGENGDVVFHLGDPANPIHAIVHLSVEQLFDILNGLMNGVYYVSIETDAGEVLRGQIADGEYEGEGEEEGEVELVCEGNLVRDGSFERGISNPHWTQYSANFGEWVICGPRNCPRSEGARTGDFHLYFYGYHLDDEAYAEQTVHIPQGDMANLVLWCRFGSVSDDENDRIVVSMDGDTLITIYAHDEAYHDEYKEVVLDVSDYADGADHVLRIYGITAARPVDENTVAYVDDVCLLVTPSTVEGEGEGEDDEGETSTEGEADEGETPGEGEAADEGEGETHEGETPDEGEGETDEGETPDEGEGETDEGETPDEGEGEAHEGETPDEGEGETDEGETSGEGEGDTDEGETQDEGEDDDEGEIEDDAGCCRSCGESKAITDFLGDWLLIGMALLILAAFSITKQMR